MSERSLKHQTPHSKTLSQKSKLPVIHISELVDADLLSDLGKVLPIYGLTAAVKLS